MSGHFKKTLSNLDLSNSQQAEIDEYLSENDFMSSNSFLSMKHLKKQLEAELLSDSTDVDEVRLIHSKIKTEASEHFDTMLNVALKMKSVLTQEQFERFMESMDRKRLKRPPF